MSVVSSELGVGSLERWVSVGLWLLDTAVITHSSAINPSILSVRARCRWKRFDVCEGVWRGGGIIPVTVGLLRLVVLRRVL